VGTTHPVEELLILTDKNQKLNWNMEWKGSKSSWEGGIIKICSPGCSNIFHELFLIVEDNLQESAITHGQLLVGKLGKQQTHSLAKLGAADLPKSSRRDGFQRYEKF